MSQKELDSYQEDDSPGNKWENRTMSEIIEVNNYPSLDKGKEQTYVAMDDLEVDKRKITATHQKEYKYSAPRFKNGDTLYPKMSRCLENGKTAFVDVLKDDEVAFGSTEFLVLRPKEGILPKYVYYTMRRPEIVALTYKWRNGTTARRQRIPKEVFDYIDIPLPPIREQKRIIDFLDALDSKIESNDHIHNIQLNLLQTQFSAWFDVHIDEEENYEGETCSLDDFVTFHKETIDPTEAPEEEFEMYSFEAYDQRGHPFLTKGENIESQKYQLTEDCILVSKLNPRIKRTWKPERISERSVCSTEFLVIVPDKKEYSGFIWGLVNSPRFIEFMKSHTTGTSNSHQRVKPEDVLDYEFKKPNMRALRRFQEISEYAHLNNYTLKKQNRILEKIRDVVLPGLMTGEIRVNDINIGNERFNDGG